MSPLLLAPSILLKNFLLPKDVYLLFLILELLLPISELLCKDVHLSLKSFH